MTIFTRGLGPVDSHSTREEWEEHLDYLDRMIGDPADHDERPEDYERDGVDE